MPKGRRKNKLSDEMAEEICRLLEEGNFISTVCELVGISRDSFYRWYKKNSEFKEKVDAASAEAERRALSNLFAKSSEDWRAAAWFLERRFKDRWKGGSMIEVVSKADARIPSFKDLSRIYEKWEEQLKKKQEQSS